MGTMLSLAVVSLFDLIKQIVVYVCTTIILIAVVLYLMQVRLVDQLFPPHPLCKRFEHHRFNMTSANQTWQPFYDLYNFKCRPNKNLNETQFSFTKCITDYISKSSFRNLTTSANIAKVNGEFTAGVCSEIDYQLKVIIPTEQYKDEKEAQNKNFYAKLWKECEKSGKCNDETIEDIKRHLNDGEAMEPKRSDPLEEFAEIQGECSRLLFREYCIPSLNKICRVSFRESAMQKLWSGVDEEGEATAQLLCMVWLKTHNSVLDIPKAPSINQRINNSDRV